MILLGKRLVVLQHQGGGPSYKPIRVGTGNTCDTMSGIMAALSLLAALLQRERTGVAQRVDSSQLGAFMTLTNLTISQYLESGKQLDDGIMSGHHWNSYLDDYLSKDRKWFAIGARPINNGEEFAKHWEDLI